MSLLAFALAAALLAQADLPQNRSPAMRCKASCEAHVKNPQTRARVCNPRCFFGGGSDRAGWVSALGTDRGSAEALQSALEDPDWAVRFGAVRAAAKGAGEAELSALATWIMKANGPAAVRAFATAAHVAGQRKVTTAELLKAAGKDGPAAAAKVWKEKAAVRAALELELYGTDPLAQQEALSHLAIFLSIPEGRVALEAMRSKPEGTDTIIAEVLRARASSGGTPAGLLLLKGAQAEHKPFVDRLFFVFARQIEALRPSLRSTDLPTRKNAIRELWNYGPLGNADLEPLVGDDVIAVRIGAARAIAAGEDRTLAEAAKARVAVDSKLSPELQGRWIEIIGEAGSKGCGETLTAIVADATFSEGARGSAVKALGACDGAKSFKVILKALDSSSPAIRAGAVQALGYMPRDTAAEAAAAKALTDPDGYVLAAAVETLGVQRQAGRVEQLLPLLEHADARVRAASVKALATLAGSKLSVQIGKRLKEDPDPRVRAAAAKALGELGGPFAPGVLGEAAKKDPDSHVQHEALESLRRLGFR